LFVHVTDDGEPGGFLRNGYRRPGKIENLASLVQDEGFLVVNSKHGIGLRAVFDMDVAKVDMKTGKVNFWVIVTERFNESLHLGEEQFKVVIARHKINPASDLTMRQK
jgi:molybdate-binding protein